MEANFAAISVFDKPRMAALSWIFSRPVKSGLKPLPSSNSAATRPRTFTVPVVG